MESGLPLIAPPCRLDVLGNVAPIGSSRGTVMVAESSWELYVGNNGDMVVYSFVATSSMNSFNADVKAFFSYLQENDDFPADSQNLIGKIQLNLFNCLE